MSGANKRDQKTGTKQDPFQNPGWQAFSLKKISSDVADQAKNLYDELLNLVKYEKNDEFSNFDSRKTN